MCTYRVFIYNLFLVIVYCQKILIKVFEINKNYFSAHEYVDHFNLLHLICGVGTLVSRCQRRVFSNY